MNLQLSPQEAANELLRRRAARSKMLPFVSFVNPAYSPQWFHEVICEHLDAFVSREIENLMVFMPPQHGKSQLVSRALPAFIFGQKPDAKVIGASYAAELIQGMNRDVQRIIDSPAYARLFPQTRLSEPGGRGGFLRNTDVFEIVNQRGQYRCAGVGGGLTGFPCDFGIIDDPYKDYAEATSQTVRNAVWEWFTSVFLSRTHAGTGKLLTLTRWHEDDLAARLLELEPHKWCVLSLPALCEVEGAPNDRRTVGEALWPQRFPVETLHERRFLNPHQFEALYQQNPTPKEGAFFKVAGIEIVPFAPEGLRLVRAWDKAATHGAGDYTAGVLLGVDTSGAYTVLDVVRGQWSTDVRDARIKATAQRDGKATKVRGPQDPGGAGKSDALAFSRLLAGFSVKTAPVSGDKMTRADPFSSQLNAGNVKLVKGEWNRDFIEELRAFPNGRHDDQVDAASDAFSELNAPPSQPIVFSVQ